MCMTILLVISKFQAYIAEKKHHSYIGLYNDGLRNRQCQKIKHRVSKTYLSTVE